MRKLWKGKLRLPLAAFGLVMTISFSTAAQQPAQTQNPDSQKPAEQKAAQEQAPGAQPPAKAATGQDEAKPAEPDKKPQDQQNKTGVSKDRMFGVMPNFLTVNNPGQLEPLTPGQKFKAVARGAFDPYPIIYNGVLAGISQAENSLEGYGQGAQGYAKRYGAFFADSTIENFMVGAALPSVLHQDPRYYRMGSGSFGHRAWYAATRIFVIRGDSGREQFNASEIFGSALAAGASTYSYHPEADRKLTNVLSVWGTQMGSDAFGFMMKEFWPDIHRLFSKKKGPSGAATGQ
jgi:hypothetical protein